jgi:predicted Zn-dependent protease
MQIPEKSQPEARQALELWNKTVGTWKTLVPVDGDSNNCDYTIKEVSIDMCPGTASALACTNTIGGNIVYMRKGRYEKAVKWITLHEWGHVYGAQHVVGTLMNPTWEKLNTECPDIVTVAQVAAYNHLNLATLSWCYY